MFKISRFGSRKINAKIKWFISYLVVLIVPIIMCVLLWFYMQTSINKERVQLGQLQIRNIVKSVEEEAKANSISANQFKNSLVVKQAMSLIDVNTSYDKEVLSKLSSEILNYRYKFDIKDSVFIYLKRVDIVVNEDGYFTPLNFWKKNYSNSNIGFSDWKRMIGKSLDVEYNLYSITFFDKGGHDYQSFLHTTMLCKESSNNYAVMAVQDFAPIDYLQEIEDSYFIIYDTNQELVYGPGNREIFSVLSQSIKDEVVRSGRNRYIINHATSQDLKYKFVVAVKLYDVFTTSPTPFIYMGIIILMSAFCIWTLWVISKKNYTVIDKIVMRLKAVRGEGTSANEISMIDSLIDKLVKEHEDHAILLHKQNSQFVSINISRLLHGHVKVYEEIQSGMVDKYGIEFLSDYFAVIVIALEDYKEFLENKNQKVMSTEIGLVKFAIKNVAEEVIAEKGNRGYFAETEEIPTILVSLSSENLSNAKEILVENCKFIQKFLSQQLSIKTTISISNIGMGISDIHRIYRQAIEYVEYKYVLGEEIIITPEDIDIQKDVKYSFTKEREDWLINFLKVGDTQQAIQLIDSVLYLEPRDNIQDIKRLHCITYDIAAALIRFCCEEELSKEVFDEEKFLEELTNARNLENMYILISDAIKQICSKYTPTNNTFIDNVISYIEKVYSDNSLSVSSIAEHFNLHPTYMSNAFKAKTGVGLLEYINRVRINKSIELMMNANLTINEISEKVGYLNANTYIRIFKKLMGITPNKYRTIKK